MMSPTLTCPYCGNDNQARARFCRSCGQPLQANKYHNATGHLLPNVLLKQRYRIIEPVGQGGFGAVYRAEDTQLGNRQIAIKEMSQSGLSPQEQKEAADAFRQEAVMLAHLQHPNLPGIIEHFEENQRWYLVMSFIEGETLEDYLSKQAGGKLSLDQAVDVGMQLCTVLDYLHTQQPPIIFRDLKPANIMRTSDGHIYLIDFGIARIFKPGKSKDTVAYGSTGYAAPEQYGKTTTPRSDIYSLGVTLHQLISGYDPASSPFRLPPLQSLVPAVPAGLATFITQMLDMDEGKRPVNMLLVKRALQPLPPNPVPSPASRPKPSPFSPPQPKVSPLVPPEPPGTVLILYMGHSKARGIEDEDKVWGIEDEDDDWAQMPGWNIPNAASSLRLPPQPAWIQPPAVSLQSGPVAAWSPDGTQIASAAEDGVVFVWSTDHQQKTFTKRDHRVQAVAWSPDGKRIAFVVEGTVGTWNADGSGQAFFSNLFSSPAVHTTAWSPDGRRIAFGFPDGTVQVWPADGSTHPFIYKGHTASFLGSLFGGSGSNAQERSILALAWSHDGSYIVSSSQNGTVHIWDADGFGQPLTYKTSPDASVRSIAWSPDGKRLAFASQDGTVEIWNIDSGRQPFTYRGHPLFAPPAVTVAWSPDGQYIASLFQNGIALVQSTDGSGQTFTYKGHSIPQKAARPRAGGSYSSTRLSQTPSQLSIDSSPALAIAWSPNNKRVASASQDGTIHIWNSDGSGRPFIYRGHSTAVRSLTWSPDGKRIASASLDYTTQVWRADTLVYNVLSESSRFESGQSITWLPDYEVFSESSRSIAWSPDGERFAVSKGKAVLIWNRDDSEKPFILQNQAAEVLAVTWSPDGKRIAAASKDGTILIGNADGSGKSFVYKGHKSAVMSVMWSPDGTRIVSASQDATAQVWNVDGSGVPLVYKGHKSAVMSVAWSPDGTYIVSASRTREDAIHIWNADGSGRPFIYEGHNYFAWEIFVTSVAWSPDGKRIASGTSGAADAPDSVGRVVHIWNADGSGAPFIFKGHSKGVLSVAWSPDSTRIVSTDEDGVVLVWSAG